jgi:hypothetical protein
MPNFEGAVNPLERRGPTVIQLSLQELSGLRASKTSEIPLVLEHATSTGATEVAFSFTPPDVKLKEKAVYASNRSDRSYFPIESQAGSLPESLSVKH